MSELITAHARENMRFRLLATVSVLSLLAATPHAKAEDADRPTVWIDLGGQLERMSDSNEIFAPAFVSQFDSSIFQPVLPLQGALRYSNGVEAKMLVQPHGSDWVFTASVRYGRSNGVKAKSQRLAAITFPVTNVTGQHVVSQETPPRHFNTAIANTERHLITDFQAGKDVGLGLFGGHGASRVLFGVRFAQFTSNNQISISGVPDFTHIGHEFKYDGIFTSHHRYAGAVDVERSFHGIGPSASWDSSMRILGRGDDTSITFDWGVNGAVLFGRQKAKGNSHVTGSHYKTFGRIKKDFTSTKYNGVASSYHHPSDINRTRSVIVPNVGGFAGLSFRYANAKLSAGYRADFFFGAMDGGIDARKTYDRNFFGPFATISFGLGG